MKKSKYIVCALCAFMAVWMSNIAKAEEPIHRNNLKTISKSKALEGKKVELLQRGNGPGRAQGFKNVLDRVLRIGADQPYQTVTKDDYIIAKGAGWYAEARANGEWIRYRNDNLILNVDNYPIEIENRLSAKELENWGREFIKNEINEMVSLQSGETLEPWNIQYEISTVMDATGILNKEIRTSKMTFTRVIDGITVLGAGSKVSVIFTNNGIPVGFDIDWPVLNRTGQKVETLGINDVQLRIAENRKETNTPTDMQEESLTCGYYDYGSVAAEKNSFLQPACVSISKSNKGYHVVDAIPIGRVMKKDNTWKNTEFTINRESAKKLVSFEK